MILADAAGPTYTRWAREQAAASGPFRTTVFSPLCLMPERNHAYAELAPYVSSLVEHPEQPIKLHPHFDDLVDRQADGGVAAIASMPADWWIEIGAIGTLADIHAHLEAMRDAGADDVCLFPGDDVDLVRTQLDDIATILGR